MQSFNKLLKVILILSVINITCVRAVFQQFFHQNGIVNTINLDTGQDIENNLRYEETMALRVMQVCKTKYVILFEADAVRVYQEEFEGSHFMTSSPSGHIVYKAAEDGKHVHARYWGPGVPYVFFSVPIDITNQTKMGNKIVQAIMQNNGEIYGMVNIVNFLNGLGVNDKDWSRFMSWMVEPFFYTMMADEITPEKVGVYLDNNGTQKAINAFNYGFDYKQGVMMNNSEANFAILDQVSAPINEWLSGILNNFENAKVLIDRTMPRMYEQDFSIFKIKQLKTKFSANSKIVDFLTAVEGIIEELKTAIQQNKAAIIAESNPILQNYETNIVPMLEYTKVNFVYAYICRMRDLSHHSNEEMDIDADLLQATQEDPSLAITEIWSDSFRESVAIETLLEGTTDKKGIYASAFGRVLSAQLMKTFRKYILNSFNIQQKQAFSKISFATFQKLNETVKILKLDNEVQRLADSANLRLMHGMGYPSAAAFIIPAMRLMMPYLGREFLRNKSADQVVLKRFERQEYDDYRFENLMFSDLTPYLVNGANASGITSTSSSDISNDFNKYCVNVLIFRSRRNLVLV